MEVLADEDEGAGEVAETEALEIAGDVAEAGAEVVAIVGGEFEVAVDGVGAAAEAVEVVGAGVGIAGVGGVVVVAVVFEAIGALR